ncbi:MAG TPA: DUF4136 domain-containing protein [Thermoanaerobaculia bacterium]|nr:DUF4136 domain-containing protein [Thermoanaerobaculia bacterium]
MKRLVICVVLAVAAASCGSTGKPSIQHAWDHQASFAGIKTFAWYDGPPFQYPHGGGMVDGRFIDLHVREAVEKELTKKGYVNSKGAPPDIFVSYATSPEGILQQDKWGSYNYWTGTIYLSSKWEKEGTLALDIRNSGMKLVWRGVYTGMIGTNPEQLAGKIETATEKILAKFPPPAGSP